MITGLYRVPPHYSHSDEVANIFGMKPSQLGAMNTHLNADEKITGYTIAVPAHDPQLVAQHGVVPLWYNIALGELARGVAEVPGPVNNSRIVEYHRTTTLGERDARLDETPWCSSFVNWCLTKSNVEGTDSAAADSWLSWGMEISQPVIGAITVYIFDDGRHVGFHSYSYSNGDVILGGNQKSSDRKLDQVNQSRWLSRSRVAYRWPTYNS